jgi:tetratricopeptide (TPR) repeat protein
VNDLGLPLMNGDTNQEILNELRSLRRHSQVAAFVTIFVLAVAIAYLTWLRLEQQRARQAYYQSRTATPSQIPAQNTQETVWPTIEAALDRGEYQKALSIAQSFVTRQPGYHYAHASLGAVYVAMNDFTNAEAAYLRAVQLYPIEEHEKALTAIRKRLARDRGTEAMVK